MWNVLECGGSGREKMGKREKKKREGYVCGGEKKRGKKRKQGKKKTKEKGTCMEEKRRGKKKENEIWMKKKNSKKIREK